MIVKLNLVDSLQMNIGNFEMKTSQNSRERLGLTTLVLLSVGVTFAVNIKLHCKAGRQHTTLTLSLYPVFFS